MSRLLVIDDDEFIRKSLKRLFTEMGHETLLAASLEEGVERASQGVDVIFLDLDLPDGAGQKAIDALAATHGGPEIIVITGMGDDYGAQETLASGVWDYIRKPASPATVKASLAGALGYRRETGARESPEERLGGCGILGESPVMHRVKEQIVRAAASEASVLILGETGAGKELAAQAVHALSVREKRPFIVVDCSNMTESLVESMLYGHVKGAFTGAHADRKGLVAEADGGALFLDEVGELPMALQKTFLRVLQEQRFRPVGAVVEQQSDFRLVAATNRNLEKMTQQGRFRSDLLFRLRTIEITMPPLRERSGDIELLAEHFLRASCDRYGAPRKALSPQLLKVLQRYAWPGNVRELANVMEASVIEAGAAGVIHPKHLPSQVRLAGLRPSPSASASAAAPEESPGSTRDEDFQCGYEEHKARRDREYFERLMERAGGDIPTASRLSGLSAPSIYRHLKLAGIPTPSRRRRSSSG